MPVGRVHRCILHPHQSPSFPPVAGKVNAVFPCQPVQRETAGGNFSLEPCHNSVDGCIFNHESTHIHLFTSFLRSVDLLPPTLLEWAVGRPTISCCGWSSMCL